MANVSSPAFWQNLYEHGGDGWETGAPAPPLASLVETTPLSRGRVAVIGCGRGRGGVTPRASAVPFVTIQGQEA